MPEKTETEEAFQWRRNERIKKICELVQLKYSNLTHRRIRSKNWTVCVFGKLENIEAKKRKPK